MTPLYTKLSIYGQEIQECLNLFSSFLHGKRKCLCFKSLEMKFLCWKIIASQSVKRKNLDLKESFEKPDPDVSDS